MPEPIIDNLNQLKVTDKNGNVYVLLPVDTEARQEIEEAKNIQFDSSFFTAEEDSVNGEVNIGLNGVQFGVETPLKFVQDSAQGIVLGADCPYSTVIAPEYTKKTYVLKEYCIHDNKLYWCSTAISTAEDWDASHWTESDLITVLSQNYATKTDVAAKVDKVVPVSSDNLAALDSNGQLTEVGLTVLNNSITAIGGKTLTAAQNVVVINYSQVGTTGYMYSDLNDLIDAGKSIVIKREYHSSSAYPSYRTAYYTFCERYDGYGGGSYLNFCATYDTNWNNNFNRGYVLDFLKIYSYNSSISHQISGIPDPHNHTGQVLTAFSSTSFGWAEIPSQLPASTSSDEGKLLAVNSQGSPEWASLDKSSWGTVIMAGDNALADENGNLIFDENETELWTAYNGTGFGAERAIADVEGNPLVDTYAKKSEIIPPLANGGMMPDTASITVPNNARSFISTTKAALSVMVNLADGEVPNFVLEIRSTQQTGISVKAVYSDTTAVLKYSEADGNIIEANKDYQLTCVGTCWTIAEFKRPSDAEYNFGALTISFDNDVGSVSIDNNGDYLSVTEPVLVDNFSYTREFVPGVAATIVLPFQLEDASKITSGSLYEIEDIVYADSKFSAVLASTPVTSVKANHPYIYFANTSAFTIELDANEQLLIVPTVDPVIELNASSGPWLIHGTYRAFVFGDLPNFDPDNLRYYGFAASSQGDIQAGDFVKVSAEASVPLMRVYYERLFDVQSANNASNDG